MNLNISSYKYVRYCVVIIIFILQINCFAQNPNFHIYLCFGQSNMYGTAPIESQDSSVNNRFQVLQSLDCNNLGRTKENWYPAVPPLSQCWSALSPADYFGKTMIENLPDSISIGIINVAVCGSDIRLFDKNLYHLYDSTFTDDWYLKQIANYGGNPYEHLINLAKIAQQSGVIKGILLHQGESNAGDRKWPSYVKQIYNDILTDLSLNADSIPLLVGELAHADQSGAVSFMNSIIATVTDSISTASIISSSGCTVQDDRVHFDTQGMRELGKRYALKMLSLQEHTNILNGYSNNKMSTKDNMFFIKENVLSMVKPDFYQVEIFSANGRLIKKISSDETTIRLESLGLANGTYQVRIIQLGNTFSGKFTLR